MFSKKPKPPNIIDVIEKTKDKSETEAAEELKTATFCRPNNRTDYDNFCREHKSNPLVLAVRHRHVAAVKFILTHCKKDVANSFDLITNNTPLTILIGEEDKDAKDERNTDVLKRREIEELLLKHGADPWRDVLYKVQDERYYINIWLLGSKRKNEHLFRTIFTNYDQYYQSLHGGNNNHQNNPRYNYPFARLIRNALKNSDQTLLNFCLNDNRFTFQNCFLMWDNVDKNKPTLPNDGLDQLCLSDVSYGPERMPFNKNDDWVSRNVGRYGVYTATYAFVAHFNLDEFCSKDYSTLLQHSLHEGNLQKVQLLMKVHGKTDFDPYQYIFGKLWEQKPQWLTSQFSQYHDRLLGILGELAAKFPPTVSHCKQIFALPDLTLSNKISIFQVFFRHNLSTEFVEAFLAELLSSRELTNDLLMAAGELITSKKINKSILLKKLLPLSFIDDATKLGFFNKISGTVINETINTILNSNLTNKNEFLLVLLKNIKNGTGWVTTDFVLHFNFILQHGNAEIIKEYVLMYCDKIDLRNTAKQYKPALHDNVLNFIQAAYFILEQIPKKVHLEEAQNHQARQLFQNMVAQDFNRLLALRNHANEGLVQPILNQLLDLKSQIESARPATIAQLPKNETAAVVVISQQLVLESKDRDRSALADFKTNLVVRNAQQDTKWHMDPVSTDDEPGLVMTSCYDASSSALFRAPAPESPGTVARRIATELCKQQELARLQRQMFAWLDAAERNTDFCVTPEMQQRFQALVSRQIPSSRQTLAVIQQKKY